MAGRSGRPGSSRTTPSWSKACSISTRRRFDPRWLERGGRRWPRRPSACSPTRAAAGSWRADDQEKLIAREKPTHDGAEPSGASVALLNAVRLERFTGDARWRTDRGGGAALVRARPGGAAGGADGDARWRSTPSRTPAAEVVVVWPRPERSRAALLDVLRRTFLPELRAHRRRPRAKASSALARACARSRASGSRSGASPPPTSASAAPAGSRSRPRSSSGSGYGSVRPYPGRG